MVGNSTDPSKSIIQYNWSPFGRIFFLSDNFNIRGVYRVLFILHLNLRGCLTLAVLGVCVRGVKPLWSGVYPSPLILPGGMIHPPSSTFLGVEDSYS